MLDLERKRATARRWAAENPEKIREYRKRYKPKPHRHVSSRFGITVEQYNEMLERQGGVCALCEREETRTYKGTVRALSVDHDHATGRVRGLLCFMCNLTLGHAEDNPALLRAAADYIERGGA